MATSKEEMIELSEDGLTLIKVNNSAIKDGTFTIPYSVNYIGNRAFHGCISLTSITMPNLVISIGDGAFKGCTSLKSITIPDSVTGIGICAFYGCTSLTSITIPNSVTSIGDWVFNGCTSLTSITIPDSVTVIGACAFEGCTILASITIPNSVTDIGGYAFYDCTGLTSITIPISVTSIDNFAFWGCISLTNIIIDSDDPGELQRITDLLPAALRNKIVIKQAHIESQAICEAALKRITNDPKTTDASQLIWKQRDLPFLPLEMLVGISLFCENKYTDAAHEEMHSVKIPADNNWGAYVLAIDNITTRYLGKASSDFSRDKSLADKLITFAINHPYVTSGVAGLLAALAVVATTSISDVAPAIAASTAGLIASTATFFSIPVSLSAHIASQNKADTPTDEEPAAQPAP